MVSDGCSEVCGISRIPNGGRVNQPGAIAITGLGSPLADGLANRLLESAPRASVVALGMRLPVGLRGKLELHPVDPGDPDAEAEIGNFLQRRSIEAVAHLPFEPAPGDRFDGDVGWLARAAVHVGRASAQAGVRRLVVASSTMCYGARPENPNFLDEDRDLVGHTDSPWLLDQCAAEEAMARPGPCTPAARGVHVATPLGHGPRP